MLTQPVRFSKLRNAVVLFMTIAVLAGVVIIGWGIVGSVRSGSFLEQGLMPVAIGVLVIAASVAVLASIWLLLKIESYSHRQYNQMLEVCERLSRQSRILTTIAENSQISDAARGIAHREQEREAVRNAIREEMARQDWEAALYLIDQMEQRFGYQEEAERLRQEVIASRTADMRDRLDEALQGIEVLWEAHDWDRAVKEIERLLHILPDDKHTVGLYEEHKRRREAHKEVLLAAWDAAVKQGDAGEGDIDVDRAIELLKELDQYLTREEARVLEESARGVFKARLVQLGMQFEYAVKDRRWRDALEIGVQIIDEFPNSRMAREVRETQGALRQRAGMSGDVEVTAQPNRSSHT